MADKYIKLSQALEVLDSCSCWWAHDRMELIPAADVRPVVFCKDCEHSDKWYADRLLCYLWNEQDGNAVFEDGFCNYGSKKEES